MIRLLRLLDSQPPTIGNDGDFAELG
jgi:hypothetical protein